MTEKTYKIEDGMLVMSKNMAYDKMPVETEVMLALTDLKHRIIDPTTESVILTAIIRGGDDTITVTDLCVDHRPDEESDSRMNYQVASWKHQVPESVKDVYDELSQNLGLYINNLTEPEDTFETTGIAVGDPSNEILFTTTSQAVPNALFAGTDAEEEEDVDGTDNEEIEDEV